MADSKGAFLDAARRVLIALISQLTVLTRPGLAPSQPSFGLVIVTITALRVRMEF